MPARTVRFYTFQLYLQYPPARGRVEAQGPTGPGSPATCRFLPVSLMEQALRGGFFVTAAGRLHLCNLLQSRFPLSVSFHFSSKYQVFPDFHLA
jgi:hypothetical protein